MKLSTLSSLPFAVAPGWTEIEQTRPRLAAVYAGIVLPLSLLPPAMLYLNGAKFFSPWLADAATRNWGAAAVEFFLTEVICLIAMSWVIRAAASRDDFRIHDRDTYLLAGIAPIPLWLSSLGMLIPDLYLNVVLSLAAFGLSCGIIYHGVAGFTHSREDVHTASVAYAVMSAGLMAWIALLLVIAL